MAEFPHEYQVAASAGAESIITLTSPGLADLASEPPPQFGGPGKLWSPEHLVVASVADCFILTFRAVARGSRFTWQALTCQATGILDRVDGKLRFTRFDLLATLTVPAGTDPDKAVRLLEKSEAGCLITNSMTSEIHLQCRVDAG